MSGNNSSSLIGHSVDTEIPKIKKEYKTGINNNNNPVNKSNIEDSFNRYLKFISSDKNTPRNSRSITIIDPSKVKIYESVNLIIETIENNPSLKANVFLDKHFWKILRRHNRNKVLKAISENLTRLFIDYGLSWDNITDVFPLKGEEYLKRFIAFDHNVFKELVNTFNIKQICLFMNIKKGADLDQLKKLFNDTLPTVQQKTILRKFLYIDFDDSMIKKLKDFISNVIFTKDVLIDKNNIVAKNLEKTIHAEETSNSKRLHLSDFHDAELPFLGESQNTNNSAFSSSSLESVNQATIFTLPSAPSLYFSVNTKPNYAPSLSLFNSIVPRLPYMARPNSIFPNLLPLGNRSSLYGYPYMSSLHQTSSINPISSINPMSSINSINLNTNVYPTMMQQPQIANSSKKNNSKLENLRKLRKI